MKKLKKKVFLVIFLILTAVLTTVLAVYNVQLYNQRKDSVIRSLNMTVFERLDGVRDGFWGEGKGPKDDFGNIRFMDSAVYTVVIDGNNEPSLIINHSDSDVDEKGLTEAVEDFISQDISEYIGNLYFNRYSCNYRASGYVTVVDNSGTNKLLRGSLLVSAGIYLALEALIALLAFVLTRWIAKPVAQSFDRQKQFIADASHELKTPLAVITASADALESNPAESKWLENIKSESDRMNKLITDLLELAKSEEVDDKSEFAAGSLSKLVEKSALTFEGIMFEKGITLNDSIQDGIDFYMNEYKIRQLMSILLDNAVKHSSSGGEITVLLSADRDITLCVTNSGEGIPSGEEERIFERFYRVDESRNRNDNRYGLGLAIAKNIVEAHGGKISAASENGLTTFKVVFDKKQ